MGKIWKYRLVIQVPIQSMGDFDRMVEAEQKMSDALKGSAEVNGHDAGSGEGNLFIDTDAPQADFQKALPCLDERFRDQAKAAFREAEGEAYTILWPPGLESFKLQ